MRARKKTEMKTNTKSSQAANQLAECSAVLDTTSLKMAQDVERRWLAYQGHVERLMYLIGAIKLHGRLDGIAPQLSSGMV